VASAIPVLMIILEHFLARIYAYGCWSIIPLKFNPAWSGGFP